MMRSPMVIRGNLGAHTVMRWQALVLTSILIGGCATITKGSMQSVSINTPNVVGAVCTLSSPSIGNRTITAPNTVSIEKASYNIDVHCKKECYEDGVAVIGTSVEVMTAGNILIGGVIGLGVDAASGAINKYDPEATVVMQPIKGCRARA
jgi:hypothetical protein